MGRGTAGGMWALEWGDLGFNLGSATYLDKLSAPLSQRLIYRTSVTSGPMRAKRNPVCKALSQGPAI